jgi:hypothetical protein
MTVSANIHLGMCVSRGKKQRLLFVPLAPAHLRSYRLFCSTPNNSLVISLASLHRGPDSQVRSRALFDVLAVLCPVKYLARRKSFYLRPDLREFHSRFSCEQVGRATTRVLQLNLGLDFAKYLHLDRQVLAQVFAIAPSPGPARESDCGYPWGGLKTVAKTVFDTVFDNGASRNLCLIR